MPSPPREHPKRRGRRHCCQEEAGEDFNHHDCHDPEPGSCSHLLWELNHRHIFLAFFSISTSPFSTHGLYITLEGWHKPEGREARRGVACGDVPRKEVCFGPSAAVLRLQEGWAWTATRPALGLGRALLPCPERVWSGPGRLSLGLAMLSSVMATSSDPIAPPMYSAHGAPGRSPAHALAPYDLQMWIQSKHTEYLLLSNKILDASINITPFERLFQDSKAVLAREDQTSAVCLALPFWLLSLGPAPSLPQGQSPSAEFRFWSLIP